MANWSTDDLFQWWIVQQQSAVMVHLGKITHPVTGKVERDLETAKFLIDLLGVMEVKTKGNLSRDEERLLGTVLTNLRLNFVQEANRPDAPDTGSAGEADGDGSHTEGDGLDPAGKGSGTEGDGLDATGKDSGTVSNGSDTVGKDSGTVGNGSHVAGKGPSGAKGDAPRDAGTHP